MRTIKFRGKTTCNHWQIGDLTTDNSNNYFIESYDKRGIKSCIDVDPETVGQFTGLLDKNGTEIYEGDILGHIIHPQIYYGTGKDDYDIHKWLTCRYEVIYNHLQTSFEAKLIYISEKGVKVGNVYKTEIVIGDRYPLDSTDGYTPKCKFNIIGNIHDNPELLITK